MPEEKKAIRMPQNIVLENRKALMVTGVSEVDSFDEHTVNLFTELGELTIKGQELHISQLNVETGGLNVSGNIYGLVYTDDKENKPGFFGRLFK
ncbi:MAG: sporulation protein YabP [Clostridiales bacterium 43-6]|nr:MAG: sporulation protein YabP [Clostridiales bacterium 43-6]